MGDEENKRKRGRPKKDGAMGEQYHMLMSSDMAKRLNNLSKLTGMSRADIFRDAFDRYEKLKLLQLPDENENLYDGLDYADDEYLDDF